MNQLVSFLFFLSLIIGLISCAKSPEEEVRSAIAEARFHLTDGDCSKAQDVLSGIDADDDDAEFVSVMAASIACDAGYSANDAIDNLTSIDVSTTAFLGSLAAFPTSNETSADAVSYTRLLEAINYILNADSGTSPSTTTRLSFFGTRAGNDLSMEALLMISVAAGKFFNYYGNTSDAGVKGAGKPETTAVNGCLADYTFDARVDDTLTDDEDSGGGPGSGPNVFTSCDNATDGHLDLRPALVGAAVTKRRLCEGIILFNNMLEILGNIDLSSNDTLGNLEDVNATIQAIYTAGQAAEANTATFPWAGGTAINTLQSVTSQSVCEAQTDADIQTFYVLMFEFFLQ